jgi:hypothetical protein
MMRAIRGVAAATALTLVLTGGTAAAQKAGGVLRVYSAESPPGLNIYEPATPWGQGPLHLQRSAPGRRMARQISRRKPVRRSADG